MRAVTGTTNVTVSGLSFVPAHVTIHAGDTVTWTGQFLFIDNNVTSFPLRFYRVVRPD